MDATLDAVKVFVAKLGTVLADRRFWIALIPVGILFGLLPATVDSELKADELVATVQIIMQGVGAVLSMIALIVSWTKRPPSGKSFKLPQEVLIIAEAIARELKETKVQ